MVSILIQENVRHFIIYTVIGTFFGYGLVCLVYRWLKLDNPRLRAQLLFLPLIIPISTYIISYAFHANSRCLLTVTGNTGLTLLDRPITGFCTVSNAVAVILTPLFVLAISLAIIKAGVSLWACRHLVKRYGLVYEDEYPTPITTLKQVSNKVGVTTPDLIMTDRKYAQCFTFGFRNPVIVLSEKLVESLEQDELEAVLAHEVTHIMRKDSLLNWVAQFLRDAMLFSPVVFWGFNKMVNETEKAADDITIRITEKPLAFAQALIKVWRLSPKSLFRDFSLQLLKGNFPFLRHINISFSTRIRK